MSDIGIRFDGLILLSGFALASVVYLIIASVGLAVAVAGSNRRAWKVAGFSALLAAGTMSLAVPFFFYWDRHGPGPWVDQLIYPWAAVFMCGCWFLARVR